MNIAIIRSPTQYPVGPIHILASMRTNGRPPGLLADVRTSAAFWRRKPNEVHVLKSHSIFRDVRRVLQGRNQPRRRSCRVALDRGARPAQGPPRQLTTGLPCLRARARSSGPSSRSPRGPPYQPVTRMPYPHLQTPKAETSPRSEQAACTRAQDLLALRVGLGEPRCARGIAARGSRPLGRKGKSASFSWSIEAVRR